MLKILFLLLMSGGIPVAIAMAGASLIYLFWTQSSPPFVVIHRMVSGIDSFPLLAVPFFILAGNLMNNAGITNRIYNYALALVGWMKGGLGHVNVVGSVVFAGMSGTAIADAAGLGTIEIKAMKDHGYSTEFAVGVTAASATLGPIIPPSLPFVIYGMMANVSVGSLFLAGILPGALMAILMMVTVGYFAHKNNWGSDVPFNWPRVFKALAETAVVIGWPLVIWLCVTELNTPPQATVFVALAVLFAADKFFDFQAVLPIMTPVLLIGGMTTGVFTPTEGAIAACVWAIVLGFFWYRTRNYIGVLSSVNCSATAARAIADHFSKRNNPAALANFPNVDGVVALTHGTGCGMDTEGLGMKLLERTLAGYATHVNFWGVVVVGLGCETNQLNTWLAHSSLREGDTLKVFNIQDTGGTRLTVEKGIALIEEMLPRANQVKREPCSAEYITVGLQCGGSDGYSGISANPALGAAVDLLVQHGGTAILSETPEIYGAEHLLTRRAVKPEVAQKLIDRIHWWEQYTEMNGGEQNDREMALLENTFKQSQGKSSHF